MISLNIVWPAMYVAEELFRFWFLVFATIAIESFTINLMLKYSVKKSFKASLIANLVSGFIGVIIMMIAMFFWHVVSDGIFSHSKFDNINWIATYLIMCLGSIFIETIIIKLIYKDTIKRLLLPLMVGNLLTYTFIAYSMTSDKKALSKKRTETVFYYPKKSHLTLPDSTKLYIEEAKTYYFYDDNNEIVNKKTPFRILYTSSKPGKCQFELTISQKNLLKKIKKHKTLNRSSDTLRIILKQINYKQKDSQSILAINDTILFVGPNKKYNKAQNYPDLQ